MSKPEPLTFEQLWSMLIAMPPTMPRIVAVQVHPDDVAAVHAADPGVPCSEDRYLSRGEYIVRFSDDTVRCVFGGKVYECRIEAATARYRVFEKLAAETETAIAAVFIGSKYGRDRDG